MLFLVSVQCRRRRRRLRLLCDRNCRRFRRHSECVNVMTPFLGTSHFGLQLFTFFLDYHNRRYNHPDIIIDRCVISVVPS